MVGPYKQSKRAWRSCWEQWWRNRPPEVAWWAPSEVGREELHQNHQCLRHYLHHPIQPKIAQGRVRRTPLSRSSGVGDIIIIVIFVREVGEPSRRFFLV